MSRTSKFFILALAMLMFTLSACGQAADPRTITASDAGKTIELQKGSILVVSLEGNFTTGYNWELAEPFPAILQQAGEPAVTPTSDAMGAPGTIVLKFTAVQPGQANLKLVYHRPWEKDVPPAETFEVTVVVK